MANRNLVAAALVLTAFVFGNPAQGRHRSDPLLRPIEPVAASRWLAEQPPLHVYGNTYLVGFGGLNVGLIKTKAGLILIDGSLPQGVKAVEAHIRALGFRVRDIRYILSTEPHFDHASGIAALARDSRATVIAGKAAVPALESGGPGADDPQANIYVRFPGIKAVRGIADGAAIRLGGVTVTAIATPGHTAGSTSWTWSSCESGTCKTMVFASSLNPVSADDYLFSDPVHAGVVDGFRRSFARMRTLPCDVLISAHPDQSGGDVKAAALRAGATPNPFLDQGACRAYADMSETRLDTRLAKEKASHRP